MACQQQDLCAFKDREPPSIENQVLLLMLRINGLPLRQIKREPCWKPKEKGNITSRTSLFGIVSKIFRLDHPRSEEDVPSHVTNGKIEASEAMADRATMVMAEALARRANSL